MKAAGLIREVFTFVDASQLVSKRSPRDDRDKAIAKGLEKFNNETAAKIAADRQARFGAKGKNRFWYGYKEHTSVDMQSGLVNKVAASPANVDDATGSGSSLRRQRLLHCTCAQGAQAQGVPQYCHRAVIKKNTMIGKDRDRDRWLSKIRTPYERVFSKRIKGCAIVVRPRFSSRLLVTLLHIT